MRNSGIVGITHEEDGEPMANRSVVGRVALGKPAEDGRNYPTKINYFLLKTKELVDGNIEWPENDDMMDLFDSEEGKPTELPIMLVDDDPNEILFSQLQYWRKGEAGDGFRFCYGDGETAMRWDDEKEKHVKFADPDDPNADGECPCEFYTDEGVCDSRGYLYFQVLKPDGNPVDVGGLFSYQTSSAKIIRKLQGSIKTVKQMISAPNQDWRDAEIKGRRLSMKIDYMSHHYRDGDNNLRRGIVAYPYITLPIDDSENPHDSLKSYRTDPSDIDVANPDSTPGEDGLVNEEDVAMSEDEADDFFGDDNEFDDSDDDSGESDDEPEDEPDDEPEDEAEDEPEDEPESGDTDDSDEGADDEEWGDLDDMLD